MKKLIDYYDVLIFEMEYDSGKFPNQRLGQAFYNSFYEKLDLDKEDFDLFNCYEDNEAIVFIYNNLTCYQVGVDENPYRVRN